MRTHLVFVPLLACLSVALSAQTPQPKPEIKLEITVDFLALHVQGQAPAGSVSAEYRFSESGNIPDDASWQPVTQFNAETRNFQFDLPLSKSRWSAIQVRALDQHGEIAKKKTGPDIDNFKMLTPTLIASLPEAERQSWTIYTDKSIKRAAAEFDALATECRTLGKAVSTPAPDNRGELELDSDTPESWFASEEANTLADAVISFQTPSGGWSKAVDYKAGRRQPGMHWTSQKGDSWHYCGTFDNRTTTEQLKLLAGVHSVTHREDVKAALLRGLDYVFEAQFPNGGWPQNYPIESGYHEAITLNDNAMVHVMEVLLLISEKKAPFTFADDALRKRAQAAFDRGIQCFQNMQVSIDATPTVWCAQHHPITLEPVQARTKEPPSLSGGESGELLKFLMRKAPITEQTTAIIEKALAWFDTHKLTGLRKTKNAAGSTDYVEDPASTEVYWARFYDLKTGQAIFPGSQDGIHYASYHEMAAKNKVAYDFMTNKPAELISKEVARWKKRIEKK